MGFEKCINLYDDVLNYIQFVLYIKKDYPILLNDNHYNKDIKNYISDLQIDNRLNNTLMFAPIDIKKYKKEIEGYKPVEVGCSLYNIVILDSHYLVVILSLMIKILQLRENMKHI